MQDEISQSFNGKALEAKTEKLEVKIERHAWAKMFGWCKAAKSEVSGLGMVTLEGSVFHVSDVFFPKQKGSSGFTELDDNAVGKLNYSLHKKKKDVKNIRFWWHTHYNFNTFWSGTDHNTARTLARANGEWELSLVINKAGDHLCRFDSVAPLNLFIDKLPVSLCNNSAKQKRKRNYKTDIEKWVKPMYEQTEVVTPSYAGHYPYPYQQYQQGYVHRPYHQNDHYTSQEWYKEWKKERESHPVHTYEPGEVAYRQEEVSRQLELEYEKNLKRAKEDSKSDTVSVGEKYVIHGGKLMNKKKYDAMLLCSCEHLCDWQLCTCTKECDMCGAFMGDV